MEKTIRDALNERVISESGLFFGIARENIKTLGGFENFVFEYEDNNELFILRLVHSSHRKSTFVEAEIEFIDHLSKSGARVSNIVRSLNGNLIEKVYDDFDGYFSVCVFEKAPGDFVKKEKIDEKFNFNFGIEVAKLHKITKNFTPNKKRYHWYEEDWIEIGVRNLKDEEQFIVDIAKNHVKKLMEYKTDIDSYGLIHTDLHFGNMYYDNGLLTFFDWDDSAYKHFISDIAIIIFYQFGLNGDDENTKENKVKVFLNDFMKGYNTINKLDYEWFLRLNDFLKLREIILYMVLHGAGDAVLNSPFGKRFVSIYKDRIINNIPFINLDNVLEKDKWNL